MKFSFFTYMCLILLLLCGIKAPVFLQTNHHIRFSNITTDDGLPSNTITSIINDNLGFIWIATNDGLCRYEGSGNVKTYRSGSPEIEGGLESSNIRCLYLDTKQNLWIGTRHGGVTRYHQPSGEWKTFRRDKNNPRSLSHDEVLTITEDSKGRIWLGTEDGLNLYVENMDSFITFKTDSENPNSLKTKAILSVQEDDKGWIWVGTWGGGLHLLIEPENGNIAESNFRSFAPNKKSEALNVWKIFQDSRNNYWVGSRGAGLFLMELPSTANNTSLDNNWEPIFHNYIYNNKSNQDLASDNLEDIFEGSNGDMWIGTVDGLCRLDAKQIRTVLESKDINTRPQFNFDTYTYQANDENSLINKDATCIFEDVQGIIWVGTFSGISQYNWSTNQFEVHEFFGAISGTTNSQNLYVDPYDVAWLGNGDNGLLKYDFKKEEKSFYNGNKDVFKDNSVFSVYSPDDSLLYIGTQKGIAVLDMEKDKIKNYPYPNWLKNEFNSFFIRSLYVDHLNRVWIGSEQGLIILLENEEKYIWTKHNPQDQNSISDNAINQIFKDSNKDIWISTYNGLNKLNSFENDLITFTRFKHDPEDPEKSIPSNRIVAFEEVEGILYLGGSSGLHGYDLKNKYFYNFSADKNKYSIQSIEKTDRGNLWASTSEGIVFFDTKSKTFNAYEKRDGLGDIVFQNGSSYRDKKGNFSFGSRRGITKFNPQQIKRNEIAPPVYVTDIKKMSPNGEVLSNGTFAKEIVLDYNDYYLSLDFVALNYNRSEKNKYAYRLEGFEENWTYTENIRTATYTNLKHGEYSFRVKAANNDGVWNEEGTTIKIIKRPAIWETWWFKLGALFLGILIILSAFRYYTRSIKERNRILQKYNDDLNLEIKRRKEVELKLQRREHKLVDSNKDLQRSNKDLEQFAYIASHDLQEPLRVVGSFIGLLKHRYKEHFDKEAFEYIDFAVDGVRRMSQQINSILTFSKVGKKEIVFEQTNLNEVVKTKIRDQSETIKEKNAVIKSGPLPEILCEKNQIEMVFNNLISNALKFNKSETPKVTIAQVENHSDDFWKFSVKDNGIGIEGEYQDRIFDIFRRLHNKRDYKGTGIGLALCKKIIHRHKGEIWVESEIGEGTTFFFTIAKNLKSETEDNTEDEKSTSNKEGKYAPDKIFTDS